MVASGGSGYSRCRGDFERVAAGLDLTAQVTSLAGYRRDMLELVVIGFELGVGDAPVRNGHVGGNEALAVALLVTRAHLEFHVGPAPSVPAPMHARATHDLPRQERAQPPHGQRFLRWIVPDGERIACGVLHEIVADHVAQLVSDVRDGVVFLACAHGAALECDHLEPGLRKLLPQNAAGPAEADHDRVDFLQFRCHSLPPVSSYRQCRRDWR